MSNPDQHESHSGLYFKVFIALWGLTLVSIVAALSGIQDRRVLTAIVVAVTVAQMLIALTYFMNLKFEKAWKYLLLVPTVILAVALPIALRPDIGESYYVSDVPQLHDYPEQTAKQKHGHAEQH